MKSLDRTLKDKDIVGYIAITKPYKEYPVPVFNGIAFLTGMGMDKELDKIIEVLK